MRVACWFLVLALALCADARPKRRRLGSEEGDAVTKPRHTQSSTARASTCGYESCHPITEGVLNVHLIAHTHDDVGWLKTLDQYYYGSNTNTQRAGVQYILDSVVDALLKDPSRRFVYVETAFFWKWWQEQDDQKRHIVKRLVDEGRLEFAGGAWSMNDEATTHYQSIVDQFTWGLRKLNDTFGTCGRPRAGWQIDPFGHSREQANLFAAMGYDGVLLGRADFQDKKNRIANQEMEMMWRGSDDLGASSDLFTGIMFNTYAPPPGFCFDILCSDDPIIDDINSPDYNVDVKVKAFLDYIEKQHDAYTTSNVVLTMGEDFHYQDANSWYKNLDKMIKCVPCYACCEQASAFMGAYIALEQKAYKTGHLTVTMGGDFTYMHAEMWYKNMDKLIKYVNANEPKVKLFYSNPSCYIKAVHDANVTLSTKQDDFFPYASDGNSFWTGYFSSRPTLKYFERKGNNILQVCKQLYAMTNLNEKDKVDLNMLRSAMGVMQHHDAVTGTEKQHVARDYARLLDQAVQDCLVTTKEALHQLMSEKADYKKRHHDVPRADVPYLSLTMCALNVTECKVSEQSTNFIVTVYNPLGHVINHHVRVPVTGSDYIVRDTDGEKIPSQIVTISSSTVRQLQRDSNATEELVFLAADLPPLGYRSYHVSPASNGTAFDRTANLLPFERAQEGVLGDQGRGQADRQDEVEGDDFNEKLKEAIDEEYSIGNDLLRLSIDPQTGFISKLYVANKNLTIPLHQELLYYEGQIGNNAVPQNRSSGAYILRPNGSTPKSISAKPDNRFNKGALVEELYQRFSEWASQTIRIYKGSNHVEFEWVVGPIPVEDGIGKEVISRFSTDMETTGTFYTDANGRQLLKRVRNYRPSWNLDLAEPVAGNYYPVTSVIAIHDDKTGLDLSVLTDRAQGGSSLKDGEVELMVHRRLLHDDAFGVGEALNEEDGGRGLVAKGTHYLLVGDVQDKVSVVRRELILLKQLEPAILVSSADNFTFAQWQQVRNEFSGLTTELPGNVHLLTVEPWKDNTVLIRLEHFLQKTDDPADLSKPIVVNIKRIFSGIEVTSVRETTLGGNVYLEESKRMEWRSQEFKEEVEINYVEDNSLPQSDQTKYMTVDTDSNNERTNLTDDIAYMKKQIKDNRKKIQDILATVQAPDDESHLTNIKTRETDTLREIRLMKEQIDGMLRKLQNLQDLEDANKRHQKKSQKKNKDRVVKDDYYPTGESNYRKNHDNVEDGYYEITLEPMQIRTFILTAKFLD